MDFVIFVFRHESERCSVVFDSLQLRGLYSPWNSPGQNAGVGSLSLLQGIFLTQGSNPGLPDCRRFLYQLSQKGSPTILEWVDYPFSVPLPNPGIKPGSPALQADSLPAELPGKPIAKSCPTLCNPMDCSTPGFPVLHYLPEFAQICVH